VLANAARRGVKRAGGGLLNIVKKRLVSSAVKRVVGGNPNDAERNIGYGAHDAKIMYTKKRRFNKKGKGRRRNKAKYSLKKKQRVAVRSIAKRLQVSTSKVNETMFQTIEEANCAVDNQQCLVKSVAPCYTGFNSLTDHGNALHQIFWQVYNAGDINVDVDRITQNQLIDRMKLHFIGSHNSFTLFNQGTETITVKVYRFGCKKTLPYADLAGSDTVFAINDQGSALTNLKGFVTLNGPPESDMGGANVVAVQTYTTPGWEPTNMPVMQKYFSLENSSRYEMGANAKIHLDHYKKINFTAGYKTFANNCFIKNISELWCFVVAGQPYFYNDGGTPTYKLTKTIPLYGGVLVQHNQKITWKSELNSLDTDDQKDKLKGGLTKSVATHLVADANGRIENAAGS